MKKYSSNFVFVAVLIIFGSIPAHATHFRYGHITWAPVSGTTVEFQLQNVWRRDSGAGHFCVDTASLGFIPCTGADGSAGVGDVTLELQGPTVFDPGDGSAVVSSPFGALLYLVTSIDPANDWLFGLALDPSSFPDIDTTIEHTYAEANTFTANVTGCCRLSYASGNNYHVNNPDVSYRVETLVDVGSGNSSPVSVLEPIQVCGIDTVCEILIQAGDPDGDSLNFRLSTPTEASDTGLFLQPGELGSGAPNPATIDPVTGVYTWDTTGATVVGDPLTDNTLYSTQVTIEDGTSKSSLDFLIRLTTVDPDPPVFDPDQLPICETSQVLTVGQERIVEVLAFDPDADDTIELNVVGLPAGAVMSPALPISGNPIMSTMTWTPTLDQVGIHVISFNATSSGSGIGQTKCPVTIEVREVLPVEIDIKPYRAHNKIKPGHRGLLPVAILSSDTFDARLVDPSTVEFGSGGAMPVHGLGYVKDVDFDGDQDQIIFFKIRDTGILCGDMSATLTGATIEGQLIEGSGSIKTTGCSCAKSHGDRRNSWDEQRRHNRHSRFKKPANQCTDEHLSVWN